MKNTPRHKILLAMICSMFTIVVCRCSNGPPVQLSNGWTCQAFTDYNLGDPITNGFECSGVCSNGTPVGAVVISDPSQIETQVLPFFCRVSVLTPSASVSAPTNTATSTENSNPLASPTITTTPVSVLPLLTTQMTSCTISGTASQPAWLVNLRLADPRLDTTGRSLVVTIGGLPSQCEINPGNTSILSCFASRDVTYPATVIVNLDGVEVNNFTIHPNSAVCDLQPTATREVDPVSETPSAVSTP